MTVEGLEDAVRLSVGKNHACALRSTGGVVYWGLNDDRQLGEIAIDGPYAGFGVTEAPDSP